MKINKTLPIQCKKKDLLHLKPLHLWNFFFLFSLIKKNNNSSDGLYSCSKHLILNVFNCICIH